MTNTDQHLAVTDYDQYVETLAENNRERDGSSPKHVAEIAIVSVAAQHSDNTELDDGESVLNYLRFNAEPYYHARAFPKDIIRGKKYVDVYATDALSLREYAVSVLEDDLINYYNEHGWEINDEFNIKQ